MRRQRQTHIARALELIAVLLAAVMMFGIGTPAFALSSSEEGNDRGPIMVSLGDSYSSGEGVEPFYCAGRKDKYSQPDWLAHRSKLSWPGRLKLTDSQGNRLQMSKKKASYDYQRKTYDSYNDRNWYFVASSGAVTGSLNGTQNKSFDRDPSDEYLLDHSSFTLDPQLKVFESIAPGTTDYVTMTMGGNDAHFADVFIYAAVNCSFINVNGMDDYLNQIWDEFFYGRNSIQNRLIKAYTDIHNAAGNQADIIIAGYPKILPPKGFLLFSASEAASINQSITALNGELEKIVQSLQSETFKIHFVSVEKAFEGHETYTGVFKEYIHGIELVKDEDLSEAQIISSYSLHPNSKGLKAYASCVQACIDEIEAEKSKNALVPEAETTEEASDLTEETTVFYENTLPEAEPETDVLMQDVPKQESLLPETETLEEVTLSAQEAPEALEAIAPAPDIFTLTADVSGLAEWEGVEITAAEDSPCSLEELPEPVDGQMRLVIPVAVTASRVKLCLQKAGYTQCYIVIEDIYAGGSLDLTAVLEQAAAEGRLMTKGDVNGDGCVSEADVAHILALESFGGPAAAADCPADINADGMITLEDIAALLLSDTFGATERSILCAAPASAAVA